MQNNSEIDTYSIIKSIKDFITFSLKKWVVISLILIVAAILGATIIWLQKPKYSAYLTFALEETSNDVGGYANLAAQLGFNIGGGSSSGVFKGDNLLELMKSKYILQKTLLSEENINGKKELLINYYLKMTKKGDEYVKKGLLPQYYYTLDKSKFTPNQDSILNYIQKDIAEKLLNIDRVDKKLSIISVSVNSFDQYFAIAFCQRLVKNLTSFYVETVTKKQLYNVNVLQKQADSLKSLMFGSMTEAAFSTDLNINPLRQAQRVPAQRKQLDVQVYSMAYGEVLKNLEVSRITLQRETPLIQIIDEPSFPLENMKKGRLYGAIIGLIIASFILFPILILVFKLNNHKVNH